MWKMSFCEIWHSFSRAPIRNFLWCYYRWFITFLGLEKCRKECKIILVQDYPLKIKMTQFHGGFRLKWSTWDLAFTVKSRFTDTYLIRTPRHYGQFALSLGKESRYIFSKFDPLNTNTPLLRTLFMGPSVSLLTGFSWLYLFKALWTTVQWLFSEAKTQRHRERQKSNRFKGAVSLMLSKF